MANTEGMSDEMMESMFSVGPAAAGQQAGRGGSRMDRRMQTPMGERPAATVIRSSGGGRGVVRSSGRGRGRGRGRSSRGTPVVATPPIGEDEELVMEQHSNENSVSFSSQQQQKQQQSEQQQAPQKSVTTVPDISGPIPVIGSIVERKVKKKKKRKKKDKSTRNKQIQNETCKDDSENQSQSQKQQEHNKEETAEIIDSSNRVVSRFSQEQQHQMHQLGAPAPASAAGAALHHVQQYGFPSTHYALGTFTPAKTIPKSTDNSVNISSSSSSKSTTTTTSTTTSTLRDSCAKDADAMLLQMSDVEKLDTIKQLQSSLSSETIQFLKQRKQRQQQQQAPAVATKTKDSKTTSSSSPIVSAAAAAIVAEEEEKETKKKQGQSYENNDNDNNETNNNVVETKETLILKEKERMAQILSNIKNYDDLDDAYESEIVSSTQEQQQQKQEKTDSKQKKGDNKTQNQNINNNHQVPLHDVISDSSSKQKTGDDDNDSGGGQTSWRIACNLVRSTSPRQNLWAVRIVHQHLLEHHKQKLGDIDNNFPVLLPVSLRCLLDVSFYYTNGYILHTYVLQSLYLLLQMLSHPDHVIDVDNIQQQQEQTSPSDNKSSSSFSSSSSLVLVYQDWFLLDTVPTPPLGACYAPTTTTAVVPNNNNTNTSSSSEVAAYATSSLSSKSAKSDGEAFRKDPMWTLLQRMRIIPKLAQLLNIHTNKKHTTVIAKQEKQQQHQHQHKHNTDDQQDPFRLPKEAIVAICGILSMLAQRSPGVASAIIQHPTLIQDLLNLTLRTTTTTTSTLISNDAGDNDEHFYGRRSIIDTTVAIPAIILMCTLARQSRIVASHIASIYESIGPPILMMRISSDTIAAAREQQTYHKLQQYTILLWRILLRYGLCLSSVSTMLTLSASHLTLNPLVLHSLSTEYVTCFCNVYKCAQVIQTKNNQLQQQQQLEGSGVENQNNHNFIIPDEEVQNLLTVADKWLFPSVIKPVLVHCVQQQYNAQAQQQQQQDQDEKGTNSSVNDIDNDNNNNNIANNLRVNAGRLRLLSAYLDYIASKSDSSTNEGGEDDIICVSADDNDNTPSSTIETVEICCLRFLKNLQQTNGLVEESLKLLSPTAFRIDFHDDDDNDNNGSSGVVLNGGKGATAAEAAASAFIDAFVSIQIALFNRILTAGHDNNNSNNSSSSNEKSMDLLVSLMDGFTNLLFDYCCVFKPDDENNNNNNNNNKNSPSFFPTARRGWLNRACYAIIKFLRAATASNVLMWTRVRHLMRGLEYTLLGRLERGDEAMAVLLFNHDKSFKAFDKSKTPTTTSPVTTTTLSIGSVFLQELCQAKMQLDHSYKLMHGLGLTAQGYGPFQMDSLLSDADRPPSPRPVTSNNDNNQLSPSNISMLPMGTMWLWQTLSGILHQGQKQSSLPGAAQSQDNAAIEQEGQVILCSCLRIIVELEEEQQKQQRFNSLYMYASRIPTGAKCYHLLNLAMQPEAILRLDHIMGPAEKLFDTYFAAIDCDFGRHFAHACNVHNSNNNNATSSSSNKNNSSSSSTEGGKNSGSSNDGGDDIDVDAVVSALSPKSTTTTASKRKEIQCLTDFADDLCNLYLEYGAQYDLFTKFVRLFLLPVFPTKTRVHVLNRLEASSILHVLALPSDNNNDNNENKALSSSLILKLSVLSTYSSSSSNSSSNSSTLRESPEFLDALASTFTRNNDTTNSRKVTTGFLFLFTVAILSKSLCVALVDYHCSSHNDDDDNKSNSLTTACSTTTTATAALAAIKKRMYTLDVHLLDIIFNITSKLVVQCKEKDYSAEALQDAVVKTTLDVIANAQNSTTMTTSSPPPPTATKEWTRKEIDDVIANLLVL